MTKKELIELLSEYPDDKDIKVIRKIEARCPRSGHIEESTLKLKILNVSFGNIEVEDEKAGWL